MFLIIIVGIFGLSLIYFYKLNYDPKQNEISERLNEVIEKTFKIQKVIWDEYEESEGELVKERKEKLYNYIVIAQHGHDDAVNVLKSHNIKITEKQSDALKDIEKNFKIILGVLK